MTTINTVSIDLHPFQRSSQELIQPIIMIIRLILLLPLRLLDPDSLQQRPDLGVCGELILSFVSTPNIT